MNSSKIEYSPPKEYTAHFTREDWEKLWKDFMEEFDRQTILDKKGNVSSMPTNLTGSKGVVYLHEESKGKIPHLHGAFCRVDENGNVNNDHDIHLRGMLDTYSPEQQMEIDAKTVSESAKTLADASSQIQKCVNDLPVLIAELKTASTLTISEEARAEIIEVAKNTGIAASNAFKKSVNNTVLNAQKEIKHVSIPAVMAYCLFYVFILLFAYMSIILAVNGFVWHNKFIWLTPLIMVGCMAPIMVLNIFAYYKGWI